MLPLQQAGHSSALWLLPSFAWADLLGGHTAAAAEAIETLPATHPGGPGGGGAPPG